MTARRCVLALDGPAGAGKSSVARAVSDVLGMPRLDTGAIYRTVTWAVLERGVDAADGDACAAVARSVTVSFDDGRVRCGDVDVTEVIRGDVVTSVVSTVSAHRRVREVLVEQQRRIAGDARWIVEGRDIGTVVFPDAVCKVFLTASPTERARRRTRDIAAAGPLLPTGAVDPDVVEADIRRRDELDSAREHSPLRPAADAVTVDTTEMSFDDVVTALLGLWAERVSGTPCAEPT